jgi:hypothetical protein
MTALESAHGFSAFMPSVLTIKTFAADGDVETHMADLRSGYLPAVPPGLFSNSLTLVSISSGPVV